jgi:hypothetical protein
MAWSNFFESAINFTGSYNIFINIKKRQGIKIVMEQDDLIESIENPKTDDENSQKSEDEISPIAVNPLPEDLLAKKKETSIPEIINLISYIALAFAGLFILILYIIGLLK